MKKTLSLIIVSVLVLLLSLILVVHHSKSREAPGEFRIIEDMAGNTVRIPAEVNRVVTAMYPIATQLVLLVGVPEKLVGISTMDINPVMKRIYPPIENIYRPGKSSQGDISTEEIIKMKPDVVFTHMRNSYANNLDDVGIASVCLKLETPDELMEGIVLVGEIMNTRQRAKAVADYYREKLDYIKERTSSIPDKKHVYFAGPSMLGTAGRDFYQNFVIEYAGGINSAREGKGGWCSISIEHLLEWNPGVIFIGNYGTARVESFTLDKRLQGISAVRSGNVYMTPYYIGSWDVPTPESLLGIMWLANKLYPERIGFDMEKEMKDFYTTCYGYSPGRQEISRVLGEQ